MEPVSRKPPDNVCVHVLEKLTEQEQLDLSRAIAALEKANYGINIDKVNVYETLSKNPGLLSDAQRAAMLKVNRLLGEPIIRTAQAIPYRLLEMWKERGAN